MVRRAGQAGRVGTMIECMRRTERTGLRLDSVALARGMMRGALQTAVQSGWSEEGVKKAAKQAGVIMELVEDPAHVSAHNDAKKSDPRKVPDVVAVPMALVAFQVLKAGVGEGEMDVLKVEKYAKRVLDLWKNADFQLSESTGAAGFREANTKLWIWAPVAPGMRWAIGALGEQSETSKRLGTVLKADVEPLLVKVKKTAEELSGEKNEALGMILFKEMQKAVV